MHGSVMAAHFREYFLFGLFFAIVTPLQIGWAGLVFRAPADRRLLIAGAVVNGGIACTWLVSRTIGLPFGPERLQAEAVGFKDVVATSAEVSILALVAWRLAGRRELPVWALGFAWSVASVGLVAALVGGGH